MNLKYNNIGDVGAQTLAQNSTLTSLNLYRNQIATVGAKALAQNHTLTALNLDDNNIGAAGAQALAQNRTLTSLSLSDNELGAAGAEALAQNSTLAALNLSSNQIGDVGAQALAQNRTLTYLIIPYNEIGNAGTQALARNSTLASLDLYGNQVGAAGAQALAQNRMLTYLNLGGNPTIDAAGAEALTQNYTLLDGYGFKLNSTNQSQADRFLAACRSGDLATMASLLEQKLVSPYAFDKDTKKTGWHIALAERQIAVMLFLLQTVPNPQSLFFMSKKNYWAEEMIHKEIDNITLYHKAARAIESYSNLTIAQQVVKNSNHSSYFFSSSSSAVPSLTSRTISTATAAPAKVTTVAETPQPIAQLNEASSMSVNREDDDEVTVQLPTQRKYTRLKSNNDKADNVNSFSQSPIRQNRKREADDEDSNANASSQRAAPRARRLGDVDVTSNSASRAADSRISQSNKVALQVSAERVVPQAHQQEEDTLANLQITQSRRELRPRKR